MKGVLRGLMAILLFGVVALPVWAEEIQLQRVGGVYELPVKINGVLNLDFILDTGAAEVFIPSEVLRTLLQTKTVKKEEFLPGKIYTLADGSKVKSPRILIRTMQIGNQIIHDVEASVSNPGSPLLLGQSFLEKFGTWTFDAQRRVLVLGNVQENSTAVARLDLPPSSSPGIVDFRTPTGVIRTFFESVNDQKYDVTWASLSTYSRNEFVGRLSKATEMDPKEVKEMFDKNPMKLQESFWKSFRNSSKIPSFAPNATYRLLEEDEGVAVVELSSGGIKIKSLAYQEGEEWRMGYVESFLK